MSPRRNYALCLEDILQACQERIAFVDGMTVEEFCENRKTQLAVARKAKSMARLQEDSLSK